MKVQVFHLFFKSDGMGGLMPTDGVLHAMAVAFADEYINDPKPLDFTLYKESWVACEVDDQDRPLRALGVLCMVLRADFSVCRFIDNAAVVKLVQRANDHLHDSYVARGTEALVYIKEVPGQMCPNHLDWIKAFDMKPADRWTYRIR